MNAPTHWSWRVKCYLLVVETKSSQLMQPPGRSYGDIKVDGRARGLAVANGRLFVSTDKGVIHCFAHGSVSEPKRIVDTIEPYPYPMDKLTRICEAVAEQIVRETGVKRGYCLVFGSGTGRLALALARRTDLIIHGIEPDGDKVKRARNALDRAGLYGVRVSIDKGSLWALPYSDYFAALIVSEDMLTSGRLKASAKEMFRVLKPYGGVAYLGQPAATMKFFNRTRARHLRKWLTSAGIDNFEIINRNGVWVKIKRGPLPGAGKWTHQYADPGNTACSDDEIVKCPLGVLCFGNPGPSKMVSRHARAAAPLSANGRLFVQGDNVVMAYDAYNGVRLWEREIEGAVRTGVERNASNLACSDDSLFVAVKDRCLRLDAATGRTLNTYTLPPSPDGKLRSWGYIRHSAVCNFKASNLNTKSLALFNLPAIILHKTR